MRGKNLGPLLLLIWGIAAGPARADVCEDLRQQTGMDEATWSQTGICDSGSSGELRSARGGCAFMDGPRTMTDPSCLRTVRERLIRAATKQYEQAWTLLPAGEARMKLWKSCESSAGRWDKLFSCLSDGAKALSNSSSVNFGLLAMTARSILINGMEEIKARAKVCDDSVVGSVGPGALKDALNRVRAHLDFPGCDLSIGEQARSISSGLSQELKNTLDWMGCESAVPEGGASTRCNFPSIPYRPEKSVLADEDCTTKDLNAPPSSPFRQIPVYDQDGSGSCYAHAAATLANYELASAGKPPEEFVNPLFAAWLHNYEDVIVLHDKNNDGGFETKVLHSLDKLGNCPASKASSCLKEFRDLGSLSEAELVKFLESLYSNYPMLSFGDPFQDAVEKTEKDMKLRPCTVQPLVDLIRARGLAGIPGNEVLKSLFEGCSSSARQKLNLADIDEFNEGPDRVIRQKIDFALAASRPAAIDLCAEVLENPSLRTLHFENPAIGSRNSAFNVKSPCGQHAVTVTARKMFGGSCRYLVRNSWGAMWQATGGQCACYTQSGAYEEICRDPFKAREYVGCWYDSKDLIPNIQTVTRLKSNY